MQFKRGVLVSKDEETELGKEERRGRNRDRERQGASNG